MKKIAIFASGSGTNAAEIAKHFSKGSLAEVSLILTNNAAAGVVNRARDLHIPVVVFDNYLLTRTEKIIQLLKKQEIDLIVLAGFMLLVPPAVVKAFFRKMVNIHPALLPKFGGKGMYGHFVHEAVVRAGETETGITIHFVNENYDEGEIILQAYCDVVSGDSPARVAEKVQALEHAHFPKAIEKVLREMTS